MGARPQTSAADRDRRGHPRLPFAAEVTLTPLAGGPPIEARAIEISLSGVRLVCATPVPVEQRITLTFRLADGERAVGG